MATEDQAADIRAIEALIIRQFQTLSWNAERPGDWEGFAADFVSGAPLYAGARPAKPQSVDAFVERMKGLAATLSRPRLYPLARKPQRNPGIYLNAPTF